VGARCLRRIPNNSSSNNFRGAMRGSVRRLGGCFRRREKGRGGLCRRSETKLRGLGAVREKETDVSKYRFMSAHFIANRFYAAGEIASTADEIGGSLPLNWPPTPASDPLNANAVAAFCWLAHGWEARLIYSSPRPQLTSLPFRGPQRPIGSIP
jgi:hypothetical protein